MTPEERAEALAALEHVEMFIAMNLRPGHAWDPAPDIAALRKALS